MNLNDLDQPTVRGGALVLDEVRAVLTRYVVFPAPEAADAVTLYAAATHIASELEFAARLVIKSPVKRCGKSRLIDGLAQLVRNPLATADISAAALVRSASEQDPPTIMLDEADAIFGDVWESLIAIADLAGGEWPARARKAAQVLTALPETRPTPRSAKDCSPTSATCSVISPRCTGRRSSPNCMTSARRRGPTTSAAR
nr:DUF3631 domain-containing protein [Trebonia sp.]